MKRSTKRGIDDLGRITVPVDFREELGIEAGDVLEVYMEDGKIVYEKIDKTDPKQEIESLKDRINKAYQIAYCIQSYFNDAKMRSEKKVKCRIVDFMQSFPDLFEYCGMIYKFEDIGKTVFLTREEAEAAMKRMEGEEK